MTNFNPDDVLVLMDPPTFKNTLLQNYMGVLTTNKRKFTDILSQVRFNGKVHQQHLEILVCCSRQVQQVIILSHLPHFVLESNESKHFTPYTMRWLLHRLASGYTHADSGRRFSSLDPLNEKVERKGGITPALGLTGFSYDDIIRSESMQKKLFQKRFNKEAYQSCFSTHKMKSFFENNIGTLMDTIRSEINEIVKNESLNFDDLIEQKDDPLIDVIPTLPLTFNGEKWALLVQLAKPSFGIKLTDEMRKSVTALLGKVMDKASTAGKLPTPRTN